MVSALAFALLAADPAARLDAFLRDHSSKFVAVTECAVGGQTVGRATLRVGNPRFRFDAKGAGMDYSLSSTEKGYVEIERATKSYDEHPAQGRVVFIQSRISGAIALMPSFLLASSAAELFGGVKPTVKGERLEWTVRTSDGPVPASLLVDTGGKPARYTFGPRTWKLISYGAGTDALAAYALAIPLGYVPFALPELPTPLAVGSPAPLAGWRRGGKPLDLSVAGAGKARLLAVLGDDAPSRAARPFLIDLGKTMPVFLIGPGEITDPTGAGMRRLSPPGTPMFYLVGGDGKVKALWFGFERAKGAAWEAEVRAEGSK